MGVFDLPMTPAWYCQWYTGEVRDKKRKLKNGKVVVYGQHRVTDCKYFKTKEAAEAYAIDLRNSDYEVREVNECMI